MTMTERAATLSPYKRDFREKKVAENPGRKRAGIVPSPKSAIVITPCSGFPVEAALMIMAQESMQGRKPAVSPMASLEGTPGDRNKRGSKRPKKESVKGAEKEGIIFRRIIPNRIITIPPPQVTLPRKPATHPGKAR